MLEVKAVAKAFGALVVADDVEFSLARGESLGIIGPNGAGKSTLMRMLATVTKPSSGTIRLAGVNVSTSPDALRRTLGYLPQDFGIYPHLSATEFLEYIGALKGVPRRSLRPRIEHLLEVLNLSDVRSRALGSFSGGMRQRVGIAQALLNDPRLLIVDEPTAGLDPEERMRLRTLLAEMAVERIIIFSTHICSDVESIATRVAIVDHGTLLADDVPSRLAPGSVSLEDAYLRIVAGARKAAA